MQVLSTIYTDVIVNFTGLGDNYMVCLSLVKCSYSLPMVSGSKPVAKRGGNGAKSH